MNVEVSGFRETAGRFRRMAVGLAAERKTRWVGTIVWYAHFPEFGTSREAPRSYLRPAVRQTAAEFGTGAILAARKRDPETVLRAPDKTLIKPMAERVKALARANVRRQGLVRSGDLERSIETGRTVREMSRRSKAQVRDPRNI